MPCNCQKHHARMFGLIDCNNFYASCERLFRPDLVDQPLVVLSNNDGCIIARSNEAKALGIGMGTPCFKQETILKKHNVAVFSSNYPLYGDISQRVMNVLMQMEPEVEVYSIDEAFISLPAGKYLDLENHARFLKATIQKQTGIPVSIGFGPTKTLAKIANRLAKKNSTADGTFVIDSRTDLERLLAGIDVGDIWGIGHRHAARLRQHNIHTALELKNCADTWVRKQLNITGLRTVMELRAIPCISLESAPPARKSVTTSRSFGQPVSTLSDLREAVVTYTEQAACKLRHAGLHATVIHIFIRTNSFKKDQKQYCNSRTHTLPSPSSNTPTLIKAALAILKAIYRPDYAYQKAGVLLNGLVPENRQQMHIFGSPAPHDKSLMVAVDQINNRWGRNTIQSGGAGLVKQWHYRQMKRSPAYTTCWSELPIVKASFPDSHSVA